MLCLLSEPITLSMCPYCKETAIVDTKIEEYAKSRSAPRARLEVSRNNALLYTIDGYVAAGNTHAVQGYVRSKLIMHMTKLSPHSAPCLALLLYVINEGYIPSLITRVQMESMPIVHFPKPRQDVYRSLKEVFAEALLGN